VRIAFTVVIEMTDEQVERYADDCGLPRTAAGKVMAKDVVADVRSYVLEQVRESPQFGAGSADVSIKGR
jgi:hypothetical protein